MEVEADAGLVDEVLDADGIADEVLVAEGVVLTASNVHLFQNSRRRGVASNGLPLSRDGQ